MSVCRTESANCHERGGRTKDGEEGRGGLVVLHRRYCHPPELSHPLHQLGLAELLPRKLLLPHRVPGLHLLDELGRLAQDRHLGRPVVVLQLRDVAAQHLEAVLEVVAALALEDVVRRPPLLVVGLRAVLHAVHRGEPVEALGVVAPPPRAALEGGGGGGGVLAGAGGGYGGRPPPQGGRRRGGDLWPIHNRDDVYFLIWRQRGGGRKRGRGREGGRK